MPLKELGCSPQLIAPNAAALRTIETLERINGKPAAEFWKEVNAKKP
jgi:hypothetical protein